MAKKREWTVRVVNRRDSSDHLRGAWVEQLRYMGFAKELADYCTHNVIEFYAPRGADSEIWAEQNAARMRSFGLDAVKAPKWDEDRYQHGAHTETKQGEWRHMTRLNLLSVTLPSDSDL